MDRFQAIDQRLASLYATAQGDRAAGIGGQQSHALSSASPMPNTERVDFGALLRQVVGTMNNEMQHADGLKDAYEAGQIKDLAAVMLENQKAITAFQGLSAVRNRLVDAYQEINRMPL
jgi:flagellar hook-basal body complex protein FliE